MRRFPRGMSLLEAAVVLAIVGGMTALGINTLSGLRSNGESTGEAQKLLVMLRDARVLSTVTGVRHGIYWGGPKDVVSNGANGLPDLRNTLATFRKPTLATMSSDYVPGQDIILNRRLLPRMANDPLQALLQLNLMQNNPYASLRIVFNQEGEPTVSLNSGGVSTLLNFPNNGPLVFTLRNPTIDQRSRSTTGVTNAVTDLNPTERCLALERTGDAKIISRKQCVPSTVTFANP